MVWVKQSISGLFGHRFASSESSIPILTLSFSLHCFLVIHITHSVYGQLCDLIMEIQYVQDTMMLVFFILKNPFFKWRIGKEERLKWGCNFQEVRVSRESEGKGGGGPSPPIPAPG